MSAFEPWTIDRLQAERVKRRLLGKTDDLDFCPAGGMAVHAYIQREDGRMMIWKEDGEGFNFRAVTLETFLAKLNSERLQLDDFGHV